MRPLPPVPGSTDTYTEFAPESTITRYDAATLPDVAAVQADPNHLRGRLDPFNNPNYASNRGAMINSSDLGVNIQSRAFLSSASTPYNISPNANVENPYPTIQITLTSKTVTAGDAITAYLNIINGTSAAGAQISTYLAPLGIALRCFCQADAGSKPLAAATPHRVLDN